MVGDAILSHACDNVADLLASEHVLSALRLAVLARITWRDPWLKETLQLVVVCLWKCEQEVDVVAAVGYWGECIKLHPPFQLRNSKKFYPNFSC